MRLLREPFLAPFLAVASALALVSCSGGPSTSEDNSAGRPFVGHVHGLGVDPADQVLYVASHGGVFRLTGGQLELVADRAQDTMGFTVVGPNHFVASGHPPPTDLDRPIHLGLIESRDAAVTWTELSLSGNADFHSLEQGVDGLYGYDSQSGTVMKTNDKKTWVPLMSGDVRDLATHPTLPNLVIVATTKGLIRIAGRDQTVLPSPDRTLVSRVADPRPAGRRYQQRNCPAKLRRRLELVANRSAPWPRGIHRRRWGDMVRRN
ncbi:MAG: exo-alpha-sialidase [Propionibacteriaceae bacterium]|nr:exo-alpha-sialidase [Propionibacteriaceae bacterium]